MICVSCNFAKITERGTTYSVSQLFRKQLTNTRARGTGKPVTPAMHICLPTLIMCASFALQGKLNHTRALLGSLTVSRTAQNFTSVQLASGHRRGRRSISAIVEAKLHTDSLDYTVRLHGAQLRVPGLHLIVHMPHVARLLLCRAQALM